MNNFVLLCHKFNFLAHYLTSSQNFDFLSPNLAFLPKSSTFHPNILTLLCQSLIFFFSHNFEFLIFKIDFFFLKVSNLDSSYNLDFCLKILT